jgi:hypothetical protein
MLTILALIGFVLVALAVLVVIGYLLGSRFVQRKYSLTEPHDRKRSPPPSPPQH